MRLRSHLDGAALQAPPWGQRICAFTLRPRCCSSPAASGLRPPWTTRGRRRRRPTRPRSPPASRSPTRAGSQRAVLPTPIPAATTAKRGDAPSPDADAAFPVFSPDGRVPENHRASGSACSPRGPGTSCSDAGIPLAGRPCVVDSDCTMGENGRCFVYPSLVPPEGGTGARHAQLRVVLLVRPVPERLGLRGARALRVPGAQRRGLAQHVPDAEQLRGRLGLRPGRVLLVERRSGRGRSARPSVLLPHAAGHLLRRLRLRPSALPGLQRMHVRRVDRELGLPRHPNHSVGRSRCRKRRNGRPRRPAKPRPSSRGDYGLHPVSVGRPSTQPPSTQP